MRALLLAAVFASAPAAAAPLNPWGAHVGKGVIAVTPFLYVDQVPAFYPLVYGQYGITDSLEFLGGAGATLGDTPTFDGGEGSLRYFFTESSAAVIHTHLLPDGGSTVIPEYHGAYDMDSVLLTVNMGWATPYDNVFRGGELFAYIAPEYMLTETTSVFLEVDPFYDLNDYGDVEVDRLYLELVPGVSTSFAETHYVALGVALPVAPEFVTDGIYAGAWYSIGFGGE